jgi:hypothetical protein
MARGLKACSLCGGDCIPRPLSFRFFDLPRAHDGALSAGLKAHDQVTCVLQAALECRERDHADKVCTIRRMSTRRFVTTTERAAPSQVRRGGKQLRDRPRFFHKAGLGGR